MPRLHLLVALAAVAGSQVFAQGVSQSGNASGIGGQNFSCGGSSSLTGQVESGSCSSQGAGAGGGGAGAGYASTATLGHLGVSVDSQASTSYIDNATVDSFAANSSAAASFYDLLTINGLGANTGTGVLNFRMYFYGNGVGSNVTFEEDRTSSQAGNGYGVNLQVSLGAASWRAVTNLSEVNRIPPNGFPGGGSTTVASSTTINGLPVDSIPSFVELALPFTFGQQFVLSAAIGANTFASAFGSATANMSYAAMDSFDWAGTTGVFVDGVSTPYSIVSASGTDWTQSFAPAIPAVPEPPTYALFAGGLLLMCFVVQRRAARPPLS